MLRLLVFDLREGGASVAWSGWVRSFARAWTKMRDQAARSKC